MKHYLDAEDGCDGPSETRLAGLAHSEGNRRSNFRGSDPAGEWQPPEQSKIMFGGYATHWAADRRLEPRSRELYAMLLRLHIMPWFGDLTLDHITGPGELVTIRLRDVDLDTGVVHVV